MTKTATLFFGLLLLLFSSYVTAISKNTIKFVKQVPKSCKHLNDVKVSFRGKKLYWISKGSRVINPNGLFTNTMRQKASALGANRLVIVDFFHKRRHHYSGYQRTWVTIKETTVRARAFRCRS